MNLIESINIVVIGGVRPQFVKIAALQDAIKKYNKENSVQINAIYINSAQHYDAELSNNFIREFNLHFDYTLSYSNREPICMLGSMIPQIYDILSTLNIRLRVNWVVVLGDATTTMAGAIAAVRKNIPVIHIEAGVRSGDLKAPEELHRRVVSHISTVHFCSSKSNVANLKKENITQNVFWTGDMAYDFFMDYAKCKASGIYNLPMGEYILATLHKSVNFHSKDILCNLVECLAEYPKEVVFVAHPKTRKLIEELELTRAKGIIFLDALSYSEIISAIKGCAFIVTDSGGIQREACYLNKRCLVRRNSLGWSHLVDAGLNRLIGTSKQSIRSGLEWMETKLSQEYDNRQAIHEFVKEHAWKYAFDKLVELAV